jgi:hypothetical protein
MIQYTSPDNAIYRTGKTRLIFGKTLVKVEYGGASIQKMGVLTVNPSAKFLYIG